MLPGERGVRVDANLDPSSPASARARAARPLREGAAGADLGRFGVLPPLSERPSMRPCQRRSRGYDVRREGWSIQAVEAAERRTGR